jgi:hypothetical protein
MSRCRVVRSVFASVISLGLVTLLLSPSPLPLAAQSGVTRSQEWTQSSASEFEAGQRTNLDITRTGDGELGLSPGMASGTYTSTAVTADFPFNAIAPYWHAEVPPGSALQVEVRVYTGQDGWSPWHLFDEVSWIVGREGFYPESPLLLVDGRQFQYRVTMTAASGESNSATASASSPVLAAMTLAYLDTTAGPTTGEAKAAAAAGQVTAQGVPQPPIISRAGWGANESYRYDAHGDLTWPLEYAPVHKIVVHHTVTTNDYAEDEAAGWVRAIYVYHAVTLGWGDIGYNYLIDRYGNLFEGRYGGPDVVGGHVYSYNYGSAGIAVMGTFGNYANSIPPTEASLASLTDLCAWEANRSHIHPLESTPFWDTAPPNLAGHRDYPPYSTSCPGDALYAELPGLRQRVWDRIVAGVPQHEVAWLAWQDLPPIVQANETYSVAVRVRNTGSLTWPQGGTPNAVRLGYHWLDSGGHPVVQLPADDHRSPLSRDVPFGQTYDFEGALVTTPITPGIYTLAWDMVHEGISWFHDANAHSPLLTMTVTNALPLFIRGKLVDVYGQPVKGGQVSVPSWATAQADDGGRYALPLLEHGLYTVTASAAGYVPLFPAREVDATQGDTTYPFVLVPNGFVDRIANGDFESALDGWTVPGTSASPPVPTSKAHTGVGAVQLGGGTLAGSTWLSQRITLPAAARSAALSMLYDVPTADGSAVFRVTIGRPAGTITYTLPLTATGWTHLNVGFPLAQESTLDLKVELVSSGPSTHTTVRIDEVRLGYRAFEAYLPSMLRDHVAP